MKPISLISLSLIVFIFFSTNISFTNDDVPLLINYQGLLTDSKGDPIEGLKPLEFNIYDSATDGNKVWGPQIFNSVPVIKGRFNVILGTTDNIGRLISEAFDTNNRYLGIQMNNNAELKPRQQILSVPYAIQSLHSTTASSASSVSAVNIKGLLKSSQLEDTLSCKYLSVSNTLTVTNNIIVTGNLIGGQKRSIEFFSSDTWQVPSGVSRIFVSGIGGGGGGNGLYRFREGNGGTAGQYVTSMPIDISENETIKINIGKGGKGGKGCIFEDNCYYVPGSDGTDTKVEKIHLDEENIRLLTIKGGIGGSGEEKGEDGVFVKYGCGGKGGGSPNEPNGSDGCDGYIRIEY